MIEFAQLLLKRGINGIRLPLVVERTEELIQVDVFAEVFELGKELIGYFGGVFLEKLEPPLVFQLNEALNQREETSELGPEETSLLEFAETGVEGLLEVVEDLHDSEVHQEVLH